MTADEHPKPKTTLEGLAKLPPVFKKDGTVTAGTASVSIKRGFYFLLLLLINRILRYLLELLNSICLPGHL